MNKFSATHILFFVLVVAAVCSRLIPHMPNFTAIGALAIFSGAYFKERLNGFWLSMGAMLVSDAIIGFHSTVPFVYGAFILMYFLSAYTLGTQFRWSILAGTSLLGSLVFFIITNTGVWFMQQDLYPKTGLGLLACFTAAIPFFGNTVMSDVLYSFALFAIFQPFAKTAKVEVRP